MKQEIDAVTEIVLGGLPAGRRVLIGIDGVDASGKSTFAAALAERVTGRSVVLIHVDDFLNPSRVRHQCGRHSPEGFWLHTYDYDALKAFVLDPLSPSGNGEYRSASFDPELDAMDPSLLRVADQDAVILVEGMFLHRDRLTDVWDRSVFLDTNPARPRLHDDVADAAAAAAEERSRLTLG